MYRSWNRQFGNQRVGRLDVSFLAGSHKPSQVGMAASRQVLALLDHRTRDIKRINAVCQVHEMAREIPRPTAGIEDGAGMIDDEIAEDLDGRGGIGRPVAIGLCRLGS